MDKVTTIAVDSAKRVFSVYWVDALTGEIGAKTMTRVKFEEFMRTGKPSRVVLEAGGGGPSRGRGGRGSGARAAAGEPGRADRAHRTAEMRGAAVDAPHRAA